MNIGIVGSGKIGGVVGKLWARAGHNVRFSSRHPETLAGLVAEAGSTASRGTVEEALAFGEVILLSDPVSLGPLSRAREFDVGTPVYDSNMSGPEVRHALGLAYGGGRVVNECREEKPSTMETPSPSTSNRGDRRLEVRLRHRFRGACTEAEEETPS